MDVPGKKIASIIAKSLKKEVKKISKERRLKLTAFLVGRTADQLSFVKIKAKAAKQLGIDFELVNLKTAPSFEKFMQLIKEKSEDPATTGIIIQQPLPAQLSTDCIYDYLAKSKEIEGHKKKSLFFPPIGLAVLTVLKYIYNRPKTQSQYIVDLKNEKLFFKKAFRNKRVILVGRGPTGGQPIGKTLTEARINFININSQTPNPQTYFREADVIITAVGKKVISPQNLKPGVVLINVGLRRENGELKGDYEESEIKDIASFYTSTPGGIGPLDVIYLYKNLIDAAKMQKKTLKM